MSPEEAEELAQALKAGRARAQVSEALASARDIRPLAEALAGMLDELSDEGEDELDLALQVIDRARVPGFDAWLERKLSMAGSRGADVTPEARRRAAQDLWIVVGARHVVRYSVAAKPNLYDARIWPLLLDLYEIAKKPLPGEIASAVEMGIYRAPDLAQLLPRLQALRDQGNHWVNSALTFAALRGRDVAAALEPTAVVARAADALRRDDSAGVLEIWSTIADGARHYAAKSLVLYGPHPPDDSASAAFAPLLTAMATDTLVEVRIRGAEGAKRLAAAGRPLGEPLEDALGALLLDEAKASFNRRPAAYAAAALAQAIAGEHGGRARTIAEGTMNKGKAAGRLRGALTLALAQLIRGDLEGVHLLAAHEDSAVRRGVASALLHRWEGEDTPPASRAAVRQLLKDDADRQVRALVERSYKM